MKLLANDIILKLLGLLLLTAAVLKGHELLTEPVANADLWSNRDFLIFTVEFELALGILLISGVFRRIAWLAATACFALFCCVTLYKAVSGYGSCGCFGKVHVNPWITLFAIDLPAVILLAVFRPKDFNLRSVIQPMWLFKPMPQFPHLVGVCLICIVAIAITTPTLAFNEPAAVTSTYEVLEPETWIGSELPIQDHIDIGERLKEGNWLLLFYHHDCPDCQRAIVEYEQMARYLDGNEDILQIALVEIPPYGTIIDRDMRCELGKLDNTKEWFVTTPVTMLVVNNKVTKVWGQDVPNFETIMFEISGQTSEKFSL